MKYPLALCVANSTNHKLIVERVLSIARKYDSVIHYVLYTLPIVPPPLGIKYDDQLSITYTKIQLFSLIQYDIVFYVDLNTLFLRNTDIVFKEYKTNTFLGTYDLQKFEELKLKKINSAVYLIHPSMDTRNMLLTKYHDTNKYNSLEGEQGFLNYIFGDEECCLPKEFNIQKKYFDFQFNQTYILQFNGEYPWLSWSTPYFRSKYAPKEIVSERIKKNQWDAHLYPAVHNLWKEMYFKAREQELSQLKIYQMYHHPHCFPYLNNNVRRYCTY